MQNGEAERTALAGESAGDVCCDEEYGDDHCPSKRPIEECGRDHRPRYNDFGVSDLFGHLERLISLASLNMMGETYMYSTVASEHGIHVAYQANEKGYPLGGPCTPILEYRENIMSRRLARSALILMSLSLSLGTAVDGTYDKYWYEDCKKTHDVYHQHHVFYLGQDITRDSVDENGYNDDSPEDQGPVP